MASQSRFPTGERECFPPGSGFYMYEIVDEFLDGFTKEELDKTVPAVYKGQVFFVNHETEFMVKKVTELLNAAPAGKYSALELFAYMIHECFYFYFLEKDRSDIARSYSKLQQAIKNIFDFISERVVADDEPTFTADVLSWGIQTLIDVYVNNIRRIKRQQLWPVDYLSQSESGAMLIKLVDSTFLTLLAKDSTLVFPIILRYLDNDKPVEDRHFEWLLRFFMNHFTNDVLFALIKFGGNVIRQAACRRGLDFAKLEMDIQMQLVRVPLFFHCIQENRRIETNTALMSFFKEFRSRKSGDNFDLIFLLRTCCATTFYFENLMFVMIPKLEDRLIVKLAEVVRDPYVKLIHDGPRTFFDCIMDCALRCVPIQVPFLLEVLQPFAFDPEKFASLTDLETPLQEAVRQCLRIICQEFLNTFLKHIHEHKQVSIFDLKDYSLVAKEDSHLRRLVAQCLNLNEFGTERCKLLHAICVIASAKFTRRTFAFFLFTARNAAQLKQFIAFASSLIIYYPNAMVEALRDITVRPEFYANVFSLPVVNFDVIRNIGILVHWNRIAREEGDKENSKSEAEIVANLGSRFTKMRFFGIEPNQVVNPFSMADISKDLIQFAFITVVKYLESVDTFDKAVYENIAVAASMIQVIEPIVPISPGMDYAIAQMFGTSVVLCIRHVQIEQHEDYATLSVGLLQQVYEYLVNCPLKLSRDVALKALIREIFLSSNVLFGNGRDLTNMKDMYCEPMTMVSMLPSACAQYEPEKVIIGEYRDVVPTERRARDLIHCGRLKPHGRPHIKKAIEVKHVVRKNLFMTLLVKLISKADGELDPLLLRAVGDVIVEMICNQKNISTNYEWPDWLENSDSINEAVDITTNINAIPFMPEIMLLFASAPFPLFFVLSPLLKAKLASLINECYVCPDKRMKVKAGTKEQIEDFLSLLGKNIFANHTKILDVIYEFVLQCSMHEAGSILIEFWQMLMVIRPCDNNRLLEMITDLSVNKATQSTLPSMSPLLQYLLIIAQKRIDTMSDLVHKVVECFEEEKSDVFTSERRLPVMACKDRLKTQGWAGV